MKVVHAKVSPYRPKADRCVASIKITKAAEAKEERRRKKKKKKTYLPQREPRGSMTEC